jgi:hypothetical protein
MDMYGSSSGAPPASEAAGGCPTRACSPQPMLLELVVLGWGAGLGGGWVQGCQWGTQRLSLARGVGRSGTLQPAVTPVCGLTPLHMRVPPFFLHAHPPTRHPSPPPRWLSPSSRSVCHPFHRPPPPSTVPFAPMALMKHPGLAAPSTTPPCIGCLSCRSAGPAQICTVPHPARPRGRGRGGVWHRRGHRGGARGVWALAA